MKMTADALKTAHEALDMLAPNPHLPAQTGLKVRRMKRMLAGHVQDIDGECLKLLQAHVDQDPPESGSFKYRQVGPSRVEYVARTPEDQKTLNDAWNTLMKQELEVDLAERLVPADFEVDKGQKRPQVAPLIFDNLGPLLDDGPPPAPTVDIPK